MKIMYDALQQQDQYATSQVDFTFHIQVARHSTPSTAVSTSFTQQKYPRRTDSRSEAQRAEEIMQPPYSKMLSPM